MNNLNLSISTIWASSSWWPSEEVSMDFSVVTLKIGLLLESLLTDTAYILRWYSTLIMEMTLQAPLVFICSITLVAGKCHIRCVNAISPINWIAHPVTISWNRDTKICHDYRRGHQWSHKKWKFLNWGQ